MCWMDHIITTTKISSTILACAMKSGHVALFQVTLPLTERYHTLKKFQFICLTLFVYIYVWRYDHILSLILHLLTIVSANKQLTI